MFAVSITFPSTSDLALTGGKKGLYFLPLTFSDPHDLRRFVLCDTSMSWGTFLFLTLFSSYVDWTDLLFVILILNKMI